MFNYTRNLGKQIKDLELTDEDKLLRRMLAGAYSDVYLYADDGELQDNRNHAIDFMRMSPTEIYNQMSKRGTDRMAVLKDDPEYNAIINRLKTKDK